MTPDLDVLFDAEEGLFKFKIEIFAQIGAPLGARTPTPSAAAE